MAGHGHRRVMPEDADIGIRIRAQRLAMGMSQTDVANAIGVTFQQVQKYENGANRVAGGRLGHLAELFHVPVNFFFEGTGEKTEKARNINDAMVFLKSSLAVRLVKAFDEIADHETRMAVVTTTEALAKVLRKPKK